MFKKTDKQQLAADTIRNAYGTEIFIDSDHQQSSYKVYPNEREVTEERTYEGNVKSLVPGETIELQDNIKTTPEALIEIYRRLRPGAPPTLETATNLLERIK